MGAEVYGRLDDGSDRWIGQLTWTNAKAFYEITRLLEREFIPLPSGISVESETGTLWFEARTFVRFFEYFWEYPGHTGIDWGEEALFRGWAIWAAGYYENITLQPWYRVEFWGNEFPVKRYKLGEDQERLILARKQEITEIKRPTEQEPVP